MDELNAATVNANGTAAALTKAAQNTNGRSVQRPGPSTQTTGQAGLLFERMRSFQAGSIAIDEDIKKLQSMQRDDADAAAAGAGGRRRSRRESAVRILRNQRRRIRRRRAARHG